MDLTESELKELGTTRAMQHELEGFEFAYDAVVRRIRFKKLTLEFLGFLVAIAFLYGQYVVKAEGTGTQANTIHNVLGYVGTGISLLVMIVTVWGLMANWNGQLEKKHELSRMAQNLVTSLEKLMRQRPLPSAEIQRISDQRVDFDTARKHEHAQLPEWAMQQAHQHVAMKYVDLQIQCKVCGRKWSSELAKRRRWIKLVPFMACESCGV